MGNLSKREKVTSRALDQAKLQILDKLGHILHKRGVGTYASRHEIAGLIAEEYHELLEALKNNDMEEFKQELLDIAVACLFGIACIDDETLDW